MFVCFRVEWCAFRTTPLKLVSFLYLPDKKRPRKRPENGFTLAADSTCDLRFYVINLHECSCRARLCFHVDKQPKKFTKVELRTPMSPTYFPFSERKRNQPNALPFEEQTPSTETCCVHRTSNFATRKVTRGRG